MIRYRSDIDGLRTIAVLSVILYHFGFTVFRGGYVGVDIFFVISGFLIGKTVIEQSIGSTFSIVSFAERRIRRLYPALIVVVTFTTLASWIMLLPGDLRDFGKTLVATSLNLSNVQFYRDSGYFDAGSVNKPLLHTWSLAVEEQFYIVLPILMALLTRFRLAPRAIYAILTIICIASFATACLTVKYDQPSVFFLFWGRLWEMGIGIAISYLVQRQFNGSSGLRSATACVGIGLIGVSIFTYTDKTLFPGLTALMPVSGTALLLLAGGWGSNLSTPLLTSRPMVFVGLISYSLYLWHWPIFVFLNYYFVGNIPNIAIYLALSAVLILSILSWRFVEKPFRQKTFLNRRTVFLSYAAMTCLALFTGAALWKLDGAPQRYSPAERRLAVAAGDFLQSQGTCDAGPVNLLPGLHMCRIGRQDIPPSVLVWGDSHARALRDGLDDAATRAGAASLLVWQGGCPPLVGVRKKESSAADDEACFDATQKMLAWLRTNTSIRKVILIGRWSYYTEGHGVGVDRSNVVAISDALTHETDAHLVFRNALFRTVDLLRSQGRDVYILDPIPEIGNFNARKLAQSVLTGQDDFRTAIDRSGYWPYADVVARQKFALSLFAQLEREKKIGRISVTPYFCDGKSCSAWEDGWINYFDNNHLTVGASKRLSERFSPVFR